MGSDALRPTAAGLVNAAAAEEAATEERQWVRLTRRCNNRCRFCHDAYRQDGTIVEEEAVKAKIRAGRACGATRLVLSGGEPTLHPAFVDLVAYGRRTGYRWVQVVTNGRMFAYDQLVRRAVRAGLSEATVSMHGHTPALHDGLVGVPGAFAQSLAGLRHALRAGLVVSVDIVVSRPNVRALRAVLDFYLGLGVREFDLLHLIPFGRGFDEFREELFFDQVALRPHVLAALGWAAPAGVRVWTNRWPAPLLEGMEHLIGDPHKIADEIRGGFENFSAYVRDGVGPDCRGDRCPHCFLEHFCRTLFEVRERLLPWAASSPLGIQALVMETVDPGRPVEELRRIFGITEGGRCALVKVSPEIKDVMDITGFASFFKTYDTISAATDALRK